MHRASRRGFTVVELASVVAVGALGASLFAVLEQPDQGALAKARRSARQLKDTTQLRGIGQALITWAQNNQDLYPLPSKIDRNDDTVAEAGAAKDTSANIMSMLAYNGFAPVEMLVSPLEVNPKIVPFEAYEYNQPKAAVRPARALWDPAFTADFTGPKKSGLSYANLQPSGGRLERWSNTFMSGEAVVSTRGPEITGVATHDDRSVTPTFANEASNTFGMVDGDKAAWTGHVAYNDNHVEQVVGRLSSGKPVPFDPQALRSDSRVYKDSEKTERVDLLFFDEPDDPESVNDFLGIFIKAGEKPAEFKAIWD